MLILEGSIMSARQLKLPDARKKIVNQYIIEMELIIAMSNQECYLWLCRPIHSIEKHNCK